MSTSRSSNPGFHRKAIDAGIDAVKVEDPQSGALTDMATFMKKTYTDALVVVKGSVVGQAHRRRGRLSAIRIHGQWIYFDVERDVTIIK